MKSCRNQHNYSDQQDYVGPLDAIFGGHDICPSCITPLRFRAAGQSAPLHKETNCHDDYREYHCDLNYIRQRQVLHLPGLFRQFDSVGVFLISFVLFSKDLFEPLCLLLRNPFIHRRRMVAYEKLFTATVTPEGPHLLETCCLLSATLLYRHRPHLLNFSDSVIGGLSAPVFDVDPAYFSKINLLIGPPAVAKDELYCLSSGEAFFSIDFCCAAVADFAGLVPECTDA
jgi:hypothetical protein